MYGKDCQIVLEASWESFMSAEFGSIHPFYYQDVRQCERWNQNQIDSIIKKNLSSNWRFNRLDKILKAILRAAVYEISYQLHTPSKVIINEYIDITHSFYSQKEPEFVNAILEKIAIAERESDGWKVDHKKIFKASG